MSGSTSRRGGAPDSIYGGFLNNPARNRTVTSENMYLRILMELATNRFKWTGLPDSVDERFMEMTLFYRGLVVFFYDKDTSRYMAWRGAGYGAINMYDNPTQYTAVGNNAGSRTLNASAYPDGEDDEGNVKFHKPDCVPIWTNNMRVPDMDIVRLYAARLAKLDMTIDINIKSQRHTHVILAEESERQTYVNLMRQHDEGQPVVFGTQNLDMSKVQVFDVGVHPDVIPKLQVVKAKMWNECMTLLGINNSNQDKKERLVADEVSANDDQVLALRGVALNSRKRAAYEINRIWGLSLGVGWNEQAEAAATGMPEVQ